jgi:hypothetical protein
MDWERNGTHGCPPSAIRIETSSQTTEEEDENSIDRRRWTLRSFSSVSAYC